MWSMCQLMQVIISSTDELGIGCDSEVRWHLENTEGARYRGVVIWNPTFYRGGQGSSLYRRVI